MATKLEALCIDPAPGSKESADSLTVCLAYLEREARKSGYSLTAHLVGVARESLETEYQDGIVETDGNATEARLEAC